MLRLSIFLAALMGLLAPVRVAAAGGADPAVGSMVSNSAPALAVALQPGELVGHEQVVRAHLQSGTNEFMFVVPQGMRVERDEAGRTILIGPQMTYYVSVRLVALPSRDRELQGALRDQVVRDYPGAGSPEEISITVADRLGTGFELRQELGGGMAPREVRTLWVPFKAGAVEFALNSDAHSLPAARAAFDFILLTFRSNEHGKIEYLPRSDKT
jgi:hypothetical protein